MMKPLASIREAYSSLIQGKKLREISSGVQFSSDVVSMNVGSSGNTTNYLSKNMSQLSLRNKQDYHKAVCDYCKKVGHTRGICFKLHGFLSAHKNNKENGKRLEAHVQGNNADGFAIAQISHIPELTTA